MKFQILPQKIGEIVRNTSEDADMIVVNILDDAEQEQVECVQLRDLQLNAQDVSKVSKAIIEKKKLTVVADNLEKYVRSWNGDVKRPPSLKAYFIETIEDVRQYFHDLHVIYESEFHPDDDFNDFTGENDETTFTSDEATYLNAMMKQCFDICDKNDVEIYDLAGEVQIEHWKGKGMWLE